MQNATQNPHFDDESKHTAALALWRYSQDYLQAAQTLCEHDRIACNESQALYHPAAQGIEFALKSYLRAKGVTLVGDYFTYHGHASTPAVDGMFRCRMRADLQMTASKIPTLQ